MRRIHYVFLNSTDNTPAEKNNECSISDVKNTTSVPMFLTKTGVKPL